MKNLNVMQKLIAFIAACVSLVAVFALSGSGYSQWTHIKGGGTLSEPVDLGCGVTVWYHSVTVYDPADNILWQKNNYTNGETVNWHDTVNVENGEETTALALYECIYNYIYNLQKDYVAGAPNPYNSITIVNESNTQVARFTSPTSSSLACSEIFTTFTGAKLVLIFNSGINLSETKDYKFYIKVT